MLAKETTVQPVDVEVMFAQGDNNTGNANGNNSTNNNGVTDKFGHVPKTEKDAVAMVIRDEEESKTKREQPDPFSGLRQP